VDGGVETTRAQNRVVTVAPSNGQNRSTHTLICECGESLKHITTTIERQMRLEIEQTPGSSIVQEA